MAYGPPEPPQPAVPATPENTPWAIAINQAVQQGQLTPANIQAAIDNPVMQLIAQDQALKQQQAQEQQAQLVAQQQAEQQAQQQASAPKSTAFVPEVANDPSQEFNTTYNTIQKGGVRIVDGQVVDASGNVLPANPVSIGNNQYDLQIGSAGGVIHTVVNTNPTTGQVAPITDYNKQVSYTGGEPGGALLKNIVAIGLAYALPILGEAIAAELAVSASVGTALAAVGTGVAQGQSIEQAIKNAAPSLIASGIMSQVQMGEFTESITKDQKLQNVITNVANSTLKTAIAGGTVKDIFTNALATGGGTLIGQALDNQTIGQGLATTLATGNLVKGATAAAGSAGSEQATMNAVEREVGPIMNAPLSTSTPKTDLTSYVDPLKKAYDFALSQVNPNTGAPITPAEASLFATNYITGGGGELTQSGLVDTLKADIPAIAGGTAAGALIGALEAGLAGTPLGAAVGASVLVALSAMLGAINTGVVDPNDPKVLAMISFIRENTTENVANALTKIVQAVTPDAPEVTPDQIQKLKDTFVVEKTPIPPEIQEIVIIGKKLPVETPEVKPIEVSTSAVGGGSSSPAGGQPAGGVPVPSSPSTPTISNEQKIINLISQAPSGGPASATGFSSGTTSSGMGGPLGVTGPTVPPTPATPPGAPGVPNPATPSGSLGLPGGPGSGTTPGSGGTGNGNGLGGTGTGTGTGVGDGTGLGTGIDGTSTGKGTGTGTGTGVGTGVGPGGTGDGTGEPPSITVGTSVVKPKLKSSYPTISGQFSSPLSQAVAAYTPAGTIPGQETGKERQDVWNIESLRNALGI
jgi:hypothetical protein